VLLLQPVVAHVPLRRQLFTGKMPFHDVTHNATVILRVVNNQRPPRPADVDIPFDIWSLMQQWWSHVPALRPRIRSASIVDEPTEQELADWLRRSMHSSSVETLNDPSHIRTADMDDLVVGSPMSGRSAMSIDGLFAGRALL
jgi:hypothetical protein